MPNFKLTIEFDGSDFSGWQVQPERRTVQGELERAAADLLGHSVTVVGAGRTDAGVHARNYVCNFKSETQLTCRDILGALNARVASDLRIHDVVAVPDEFHSRFSATSRAYRYQITRVVTAIDRHTTWSVSYPLDLAAMQLAAESLVGRHDFASFCASISNLESESTDCDVTRLEVFASENRIYVDIRSNRFLHNMVRIIVGSLIEVGRGGWNPEHMGKVLRKKDRTQAGRTAPARGLTFMAVDYPQSALGAD